MEFNAFMLDWTMSDYAELKRELADAGIAFENEGASAHIRAAIPFERLEEVARLIQPHLNAPFNYVDIQFPALKQTVIVFQRRQFTITSRMENAAAKRWAMEQGLPPEQADWATSF